MFLNKSRRVSYLLMASVAVSAFGSGVVFAQTGDTSIAQSPRELDDIVVTANRREEAIQDVPVAITAISNEQLREQNMTSPQDLLGKVPSLIVGANGTQRNAESITIRGQGQTYLAPVGVVNYFAEVPLIQGSIISNQGGPGTMFDLESLQVLRGPQGTLFGRNTTGGALLLGPKKPTNAFEGYVMGQIGNYKDREIEGALNIPIIEDTLLVRIAGKYVSRDGFTKDIGPGPFGYVMTTTGPSAGFAGKKYDDKHYWTGRIGITWRPADGIENYLVAYNTKSHDNGTGISIDQINPNTMNVGNLSTNIFYRQPFDPALLFDPTVGQAIVARQKALGPRRTSLNTDQFSKLRVWSVIDTLSVALSDQLTFRNIIGYQRMKQNFAWDLDGSIVPILSQNPGVVTPIAAALGPIGTPTHITNASLFTEEPQLIAKLLDAKLDVIVGAYYSKQKPKGLEATGSFNAGAYNPGTFLNIKTRSQALYGQATLDLGALAPSLDGLKLTGGLRHTWDKVNGSRFASNLFVLPTAAATRKFSETTWTVGVDYQPTDKVLLFGKVTRGYKAGGFNYAAPRPSGLTYAPEFVTSYEIGTKTDFRLGSMPVRFNASAYHLDYKGLQRASGDNYPNGGANATGLDQGAITFNAQSARVQGIELETVIMPTNHLQLSANYSYTDGKYKKFFLDVQADPLVRTVDTCQGARAVPFMPGDSIRIDLSCIPYGYTPKHQFAVNGRYDLPLGDTIGTLVGVAGYAWMDKRYQSASTTPKDDPLSWINAYGILNLSLEWQSVLGSNLDARVFATNVTNKTYKISAYSGLAQATGFVNSIYGEPRMYGLSLRYRFGR